MKRLLYFFAIAIMVVSQSCSDGPQVQPSQNQSSNLEEEEFDFDNDRDSFATNCSSVTDQGKYYTAGGQEFLWAGDDPRTHFNITGWILDPCHLYYGLGREHFEVPITPKFMPLAEAYGDYEDVEKVILLRGNEGVKVYPYKNIVVPEMTNDIIDGQPIMIVYCFLADLAAVYTRKYNNRTLTFGVSGYTYSDPQISGGLESFVLWDRETESLWWPIIDKGVSGVYQESAMIKHDQSKWEVARWGDVKNTYPDANVFIIEGGSSNTEDD